MVLVFRSDTHQETLKVLLGRSTHESQVTVKCQKGITGLNKMKLQNLELSRSKFEIDNSHTH